MPDVTSPVLPSVSEARRALVARLAAYRRWGNAAADGTTFAAIAAQSIGQADAIASAADTLLAALDLAPDAMEARGDGPRD